MFSIPVSKPFVNINESTMTVLLSWYSAMKFNAFRGRLLSKVNLSSQIFKFLRILAQETRTKISEAEPLNLHSQAEPGNE